MFQHKEDFQNVRDSKATLPHPVSSCTTLSTHLFIIIRSKKVSPANKHDNVNCLLYTSSCYFQNSYSRYNLTLPPDDTVNRIILGQPFSLESYRSLEDKLALLDTALGTLDGSAIMATILHLKKTVKKTIFTTVSVTISVVIICPGHACI